MTDLSQKRIGGNIMKASIINKVSTVCRELNSIEVLSASLFKPLFYINQNTAFRCEDEHISKSDLINCVDLNINNIEDHFLEPSESSESSELSESSESIDENNDAGYKNDTSYNDTVEYKVEEYKNDKFETDDPFRFYLRDMDGGELLSKEEENEIGREIEDAMKKIAYVQGKLQSKEEILSEIEIEALNRLLLSSEQRARKAKQRMVEANLRLVISIAKKYVNRGLQFSDVIQEGNLGLMKAVDKFEYQRGYKFSTYATWWIRQSIIRALGEQGQTIRLPSHMMETLSKINRGKREMFQSTGREVNTAELASHLGIPAEKIHTAAKVSKEPLSLQGAISDEGDSELEDIIEDKDAVCPFEAASSATLKDNIARVLSSLNPREATVLRMRFGIDMNNEYTLDEIGSQLNLTRERIRQIEVRALKKLLCREKNGKLRTFLPN